MHPHDTAEPPSREWILFYESIFEKYYPIMKQQAMAIAHEPHLADDAIQDALLRLFKKYEVLRGLCEAQLVFYLVKTVKNSAVDLLRRGNTERDRTYYSDTEDPAEQVPDRDTPERALENVELRGELAAAVRLLPEGMRDLLLYKYMMSYSNPELAALYQTSQDNIRQRLSRGRRRLLELMGGCSHDE